MENKRFKPKIDKLFAIIFIPTVTLTVCVTIIPSLFAPVTLLITLPTLLFVLYFLISPLFGYVELREKAVFIKYGFILKKEIPYEKIRGAYLERRFYSQSMMSLKNAFEHVNIKYNRFDVTTVSVKENEKFINFLNLKITQTRMLYH